MKTRLSVLLAVAALAGGLAGCHSPGPRSGDVRVHDRDRDRDHDVRVVFTDADRRVIRDYYQVDYRGLPPGLAKKGKVPPGHAFKLRSRQPLPPDVGWNYLPRDVERRLSRLPDGYVRVSVGSDVAIMHARTRVIVDLIEGSYR